MNGLADGSIDPVRAVDGDRPVISTITIIIPTLGRQLIIRCLNAIAAGTHWPAQILITNQGSKTQVAQWIKQAHTQQLRLRHEKIDSIGKAASLNHAFQLVETEFVAIVDDDCLVDSSWLFQIHSCLQLNPNGIITGRVDASDAGPSVSIISDMESKTYYRPLLKYDPLYGGNMGLAMTTQRKIGAFDENVTLRFAEDNDFGYRALRRNIPIIYKPQVAVQHINWRDEQQIYSQYRAYARSQGGFYGKHVRTGDSFMLYRFVRDQVRGPLRWLRGTFYSNSEEIASGKAMTLKLLPGFVEGLAHD